MKNLIHPFRLADTHYPYSIYQLQENIPVKSLSKIRHTLFFLFVLNGFLLSFPINSRAQSDKEADLPVAGFNPDAYHGFFIQSKDGKFRLNPGIYTQFRYNANFRQDVPDGEESFSRGYNLARTRIFLEGNYTDDFYFHFRTNINASGDFELIAAYLQWNFHPKWNVRMGRQFMALGREDWIYPQDLAAMEFSAHDFTYALWSSFGFLVRHVPSDYFRWWFGVGNGAYGGRRAFPSPKDSDLAITTRLEYNILGSDYSVWDDMLGRPGTEPGILVGLGLGQLFRNDAEALETDAKNAFQGNLDLSVTGDGYHFYAHGSATSRNFEEDVSEDYTNYGFYATLGYWLDDHWFPYLRYDLVSAGDQPGDYENYSSPGVGISYYPFKNTNRFRFTVEYNYLGATINETIVQPDGQLGVVDSDYGAQQSIRFQAQFGF